jgi:hypothetical protein
MKNIWLAIGIVGFALPVFGQVPEYLGDSGNAFLATCSDADKSSYSLQELVNVGVCTGYINGFLEGFGVAIEYSGDQLKKKVTPLFCIPDQVEGLQKVRLLLKYIRDNPKDAHLATGALLMRAVQTAYPCK